MRALRIESWADTRDTFVVTVPAAIVEVEPEFDGPGSTISMVIPPASRRRAIVALRSLLDELEDMEPRP